MKMLRNSTCFRARRSAARNRNRLVTRVARPRRASGFTLIESLVSVMITSMVVVGLMAMAMYELFSVVEKRTTGWAHRGSQNH